MKKFFTIFLLFVYALSSTGIAITVHYCMTDMVGWELAGKTAGTDCAKCGMKKQGHKGCCHDESKFFKTQKDQKIAEAFLLAAHSPLIANATNYPGFCFRYPANLFGTVPNRHDPPFKLKVPIYVNNCVFRI